METVGGINPFKIPMITSIDLNLRKYFLENHGIARIYLVKCQVFLGRLRNILYGSKVLTLGNELRVPKKSNGFS